MDEGESMNVVSAGESSEYTESSKKRKRKFTDSETSQGTKEISQDVIRKYEKIYRDEILGALKDDISKKEQELERLVFGGEHDVLNQLDANQEKADEGSDAEQQDSIGSDDDSDEISNEKLTERVKEDERAPAWEDEDDEKILVKDKIKGKKCHRSLVKRAEQKYETLAREKFLKITGEPAWADLKKKKKSMSKNSDESCEEEEEEEDGLLQKTGKFILKGQSLPKGTIDMRKCQNLTEANNQADVIKSVEFHPLSRVAVVAGFSGLATLYQIDGKTNPKIQSVYFEKFPIYTAHFSVDGTELIVGSREFGHYFMFDMMGGKISKIPFESGMEQSNIKRFNMSPDGKLMIIHGRYGKIQIVSARSKEWIQTLKMNGEIVASAFNKDGSKLYTHGENGQVYVWDMNSRRCIHKFTDEGCIVGTCLALSRNEQYLTAGSDSGVVNIYDMESVMASREPKPLKAVMNLTTEVSSLKYNSTSEILAMASSLKTESIKLVHFPSMTVFSNFPVQGKKLRYINSVDLSPNSGYLMLGNNTGKVYLYRLQHYVNY